MDADERPIIRCLVGYFSPAFGLMTTPRVVTLEDAEGYAALGFWVFEDVCDLSDLTRYEQVERSKVAGHGKKRKWFEAR